MSISNGYASRTGGDIKMDKWMFVIGMIVQGVIIRLQFIVYAGFDSGIDISHIDKKKKFFRSKLSFFAFNAYLATVVGNGPLRRMILWRMLN
jgi:hypothetical protein